MKWNELSTEQKNALVAEHVMGWQAKECESDLAEVCGGWQCTSCGLSGDWGKDFDRYAGHLALPPRYTESMDAAWQVFRHIVYLDRAVDEHIEQIERFAYGLGGLRTLFAVVFEQIAEWIPETICKCALEALGVVEGDGTVKESNEQGD
jgi:Phage ABA sandwich domain